MFKQLSKIVSTSSNWESRQNKSWKVKFSPKHEAKKSIEKTKLKTKNKKKR
jgi:hypothetical protein